MISHLVLYRRFGALLILILLPLGLNSASAQTDAKKDENVTELLPSRPEPIADLLIEPNTFEDIWLVLERDLEFGNKGEARRHLDQLTKHPDFKPEKLLELRDKYGASLVIRLAAVPDLGAPSRKVIDTINQSALARNRNPDRIAHLVENLRKSADERAYALQQLRGIGAIAIPQLVNALREGGNSQPIIDAIINMPRESWLPVAAALDLDEEGVMAVLIAALQEYDVAKAADSLWYIAESPRYSFELRRSARLALRVLLRREDHELPPAHIALANLARQYYLHQIHLGDPADKVMVWYWDSVNGLQSASISLSFAEEYYGLKAARLALDLDPKQESARVTLLSLAFQKSMERHGATENLPGRTAGAWDTALSAGPELLEQVLEQGIRDQQPSVVLGATRALANTGNERVLRSDNKPSLLKRALDFPNRRVQFAAAETALTIRPKVPFDGAQRVLQTLVGALTPDSQPVAVILDSNVLTANQTGGALRQLGFVPKVFPTGREGFRYAANSAAVDLIVLDPSVRNWTEFDTLRNLRADSRTASIPVLLFAQSSAQANFENRKSFANERVVDIEIRLKAAEGELTWLREKYTWAEANKAIVHLRELPLRLRDAQQRENGLREELRLAQNALQLVRGEESIQTSEEIDRFRRLQDRFRQVLVTSPLDTPEDLRLAARFLAVEPVPPAERKNQQTRALDWAVRICRGDFPHLDGSTLATALAELLTVPDLGLKAAQALGYLPSPTNQTRLATAVRAAGTPLPLRAAAAEALAVNLQRGGVALDSATVRAIESLYDQTKDSTLRPALARVVGQFGGQRSTQRLQQYQH